MIKYWNGILVILLLTMNVSCLNDENKNVVIFPCIKKVDGKEIESIQPNHLVDMDILDSMLLIVNNRGKSIFQFYSTINDSIIVDFGKFGKSKNEFYNPFLAMHCDSENAYKDDQLKIFDATRRRVVNIDYKQSLAINSLVSEEKYLHIKLGFINKLIYQNDTIIYYKSDDGGRFSIYHLKNDIKKIIPLDEPKNKIIIPDKYKKMIFDSDIEVSLKNKKIIAAPCFLGQIDFYDLNGVHTKTVKYEDSNELLDELNNKERFNSKLLVNCIKSNNDLIYALKFNCYNPDDKPKKNPPSEILVFDWDGNPVKKYILDRTIACFAIDEKNQCIYGYAPFEKQNAIIKFPI